MLNKKAFSFVEIIITIAIVALLAVIGLSSKQGYDENMNNTKVVSDVETINNALTSTSLDLGELPMPGGNLNNYSVDKTYIHSYKDGATFGVHGSVTENTLPKKYLDLTPLDPRTNSYYAYGKTKYSNEFEIASVQVIDTVAYAKVVGEYQAEESENDQKGLIREYNGPNFILDGSKTNLPYNPDELALNARVKNASGEWDTYMEGDIIGPVSAETEVYFSDGSVSVLETGTQIKLTKLEFTGEDNLNTFVKIALGTGKIWTKATNLNDNSKFEVYTTDTTAAVKGTIFGVEKGATTDITVVEGKIDVFKTIFDSADIDIYASVPLPIDYNDTGVLAAVINEIGDNPSSSELGGQVALDPVPNTFSRVSVEQGQASPLGIITDSSGIPKTAIDSISVKNYTPIDDDEEDDDYLDEQGYNEVEIDETLEEDEEIIEDLICNTFMVGPTLDECAVASQDLEIEGYKLVTYAPFNTELDFNLYKSGSTINPQHGGLENNFANMSDFCEPNNNSLCSVIDSNTKGVFLDNEPTTPDFLIYYLTELNLSSSTDYVLEFSVNKEALEEEGVSKYIFDIFNEDLGLNMRKYTVDDEKKYIVKYNSGDNYICSDLNAEIPICNFNFQNDYIIIRYINNKTDNYSKISFGNREFLNITRDTGLGNYIEENIPLKSSPKIYLGLSQSGESQINGVIDYLKIYKK